MSGIVCTGLDGSNPLGFLAGLGVLQALVATGHDARLGWVRTSGWHPMLTGVESLESIVDAILVDADSAHVEALLSFRSLKLEKKGYKFVAKFSTSASVVRHWLLQLTETGDAWIANDALGLVCPDAVEIADKGVPTQAALREHDVAWDPGTPIEWTAQPTPFDFTSRNAQFLDQIRAIRAVVTRDATLDELRLGAGTACARIMRWDPLTETPYALFGGASVQTHPVAEWLAFRGLCFYPLHADGSNVCMAGMRGRRKEGTFRFALWETPLPKDMVRSMVAGSWLDDGEHARRERSARGIVAAFEVGLTKDATGYDGAFTPSVPLDPGDDE